jgi:protein-tyrosine phosphatase
MHVLFVCTGNIFRSLTAEFALRAVLPADGDILVSSAGTEDFPHVVAPVVWRYLLERGLDVRRHQRRTLTEMLLRESNVVIAMSTEHQRDLAEQFGRSEIPLFAQACGYPGETLPDVDEAVADHRSNPEAVAAHVRKTIDRIIALTPRLARNLTRG